MNGWKAGKGHQETGDVAGEAGKDQHFQDLQTMLGTLGVFQGASMRQRRWEEGCDVRPVCTCSSLEWRLRFRLLRTRLGMIRPGQGKGGRKRTSNKDGKGGDRASGVSG